MHNKYAHLLLRIVILLIVIPILMMVISMPVQAPYNGIKIKIEIEPDVTFVNSAPELEATLKAESAPPGGFFFLNLTIPKGYNYVPPPPGRVIAKYTWFNTTNNSKVIITIISNNTATRTVDVRYSTDSGRTYKTKRGLSITNIAIGPTSLKFTEPSSSANGSINISLGGNAGPILSNEKVKLDVTQGVLISPSNPGQYTWLLEAKNNPAGTAYFASDVVVVKKKGK